MDNIDILTLKIDNVDKIYVILKCIYSGLYSFDI